MDLLEYHLEQGVRAFSTLRSSGGRGEGAYASFNLTPYCGDSRQNVEQCRTELAQELGIETERIVLPHQTHSANVRIIDDAFMASDVQRQVEMLENVDAVVTSLRGCCIGVSTADCVPVLLYDDRQQIVGAAHAGWRGMVAHVIRNTVEQMISIGASVESLSAVVGPSIGPASFEVGEEVVEAFAEKGFPSSLVHRKDACEDCVKGKSHIDLWGAAAYELEQAGIALHRIQIAGVDTFMHDDSFFSARKLGIASGRIYNGIMLQP